MLVLPRTGIPASWTRWATVAVYTGFHSESMREPHVVVSPLVTMLSFRAIGTPASGCRSSPAARWRSIADAVSSAARSEEHTSELQSRGHLVCRLLLEKKKKIRQVATGAEIEP